MELTPGLVLDDRYELIAPLDGVGNGPTWRARDPDVPERLFTLKALGRVEGGALPSALVDHLRAMRAVRHPGVLAIASHGVCDDVPYIAQAPFDGVTLRRHLTDRVAASGPLSLTEIDALFRSIAAPLIAAHAATPPVVHGDLHPDVVVIPSGGAPTALVLDLGLTPFLDAAHRLQHRAFIAPERSAQLAPDVTADVFSLARILWSMLDVASLSDPQRGNARPSRRRDDVPDAVWQTLERATAPHPRQRPATVTALLDALTLAWKAPRPDPPAPTVEAPPRAPSSPRIEAPPRLHHAVARAEPVAPPSATSENPWATDARMKRVEAPAGFMERAFSTTTESHDEPAATDVMAPWTPPEAPPRAPVDAAVERTETLSASAFREAPAVTKPDEPTRLNARFAPVEAPDEETVRVAPFRPPSPPAPITLARIEAPSAAPLTREEPPPARRLSPAVIVGVVIALAAVLVALSR